MDVFFVISGYLITSIILPEEIFCDNREPGKCDTVSKNAILYADYNHLSQFGSAMLAEKITQAYPSSRGQVKSINCDVCFRRRCK